MNFITFLESINIHPETYLDIQLIKCLQNNYNIPNELNQCLCCLRHTDNIMANNIIKCKCPCRHFKRLIIEKQNENL